MTPQRPLNLGKKSKDIEDLKDVNHTKNSSGSHFEGLQKTYKALTWKVIIYLQKCFSYVFKQNKNDERKRKIRVGKHC